MAKHKIWMQLLPLNLSLGLGFFFFFGGVLLFVVHFPCLVLLWLYFFPLSVMDSLQLICLSCHTHLSFIRNFLSCSQSLINSPCLNCTFFLMCQVLFAVFYTLYFNIMFSFLCHSSGSSFVLLYYIFGWILPAVWTILGPLTTNPDSFSGVSFCLTWTIHTFIEMLSQNIPFPNCWIWICFLDEWYIFLMFWFFCCINNKSFLN